MSLCTNLTMIQGKLLSIQAEVIKGCFTCGKSRCQVFSFISEGNSLVLMFLVNSILLAVVLIAIRLE